MQKIEYKGTVQAITALMSDEVQAFFGGAQVLIAQARAGKVRLLGVGGTQRLPGAPDLATFAELGYPNIQTSITTMLMAPAGVPKEVIAKLAPLVKEAVASEEMQRNLRDNGVPFSAEPDQLTKFIKALREGKNGFVSRLIPEEQQSYGGEYDHLARVSEWSTAEPGDGDGE